jgi:L-ascorbate metabolism protein UlaG (beta-lactamase superfamily)
MKVKKFPQSHLEISKDGKRIVIDPGMMTFAAGGKPEDHAGADAYLFTHNHPDHLDPKTVKEIVGNQPAFGNKEVVETLKGLGVPNVVEVKEGDIFSVAGFEIRSIHMKHCKMTQGMPFAQNTGYLIDNEFFDPGDSIETENEFKVDKIALPIVGLSYGPDQALEDAKRLGVKVVIPTHYDYIKADPEEFKIKAAESGIQVVPLSVGEETTF